MNTTIDESFAGVWKYDPDTTDARPSFTDPLAYFSGARVVKRMAEFLQGVDAVSDATKRHGLTPEVIHEIIERRLCGETALEIARDLGTHASLVNYHVKKHLKGKA